MTDPMLAAFRQQIDWCTKLGSPFTATLLGVLADDLASGGLTATLVGGWSGDPVADAVPLRLAGALHALALDGTDPGLREVYPPGRTTEVDRLREAVLGAMRDQRAFVTRFLDFPPQTNEVGRSAILLGGFLVVAAEIDRPLRLLEIGASAGLNGQWDRFGYQIADARWGDPASPVQLRPVWEGGLPPLDASLRIHTRAACDADPLDTRDPGQASRLRAYIWADQTERLARLDAAIAIARTHPLPVAAERAETWLPAQLAAASEGCATVLYHSVMWQYLPERTQADLRHMIEAAGAKATETAPFAWLRFEPATDGATMDLTLTLWPDYRSHRLATAHPHGRTVHWYGPGQPDRAASPPT